MVRYTVEMQREIMDRQLRDIDKKKEKATMLSLVKAGKNCTSCIWLNNRLAKCGKRKKIVSIYSICSKHQERRE